MWWDLIFCSVKHNRIRIMFSSTWVQGQRLHVYSAKSVDYVHVWDLHICFHCLQSEGGCKLSHKETQSDFGFSFSIPPWMCVCVWSSVSVPSLSHTHACIHSLLSRPRCLVFLLRSQDLYSHYFYCACTGVTDHSTHEKRQQSNKSCSVLENILTTSRSAEPLCLHKVNAFIQRVVGITVCY